jgi:serine/threonine protein kinase/beta-lactam-binding protein with PASTA domain
MDTALSPPIGRLLGGRYHVGSRIARGGMATVYLGTDTRLDRVVALKIAHLELSDDAEFVRRFIGEARSAARLSSPNVVGVYDQGSDGRLHYIAMEYVPGRTLRDLLSERGRLSPREALDIMTGVLTGLAAAHQAGFAHRDVKPENVLLSSSGEVKVADFGLARSVAGAVQTKGGMIIGTAGYLAPEQVSGGASDARTDVYAAGIMLFELLTGTQPHIGESPLAVAYKHVNEVVPAPSSVLPGLSPALDALVAMATSRDPELRPANAAQFLRAIDEVRKNQGQASTGLYRAAHRYQHEADTGPYSTPHAIVPPDYRPDPRGEPGRGTVGASALPSLSPHQHPHPDAMMAGPAAADPRSAVNHTLVVPTGAAFDDYRHGPVSAGGYRAGDYRNDGYSQGGYGALDQRSEPWLQRVLFGRRFWLLLIGVVVIAAVALASWWISSGRYTRIPLVQGLTASAATSDLRNLGLVVRLGQAAHSPLPKGEVISTTPPRGSKVTGGSSVTLILSLGPLMIAVPNVTGSPLAQAEQTLRQAHLMPGSVSTTVSNTVPVGDVISTSPAAYSTWPQYKPVGLTVSAGPGLPDFIGQTVQAAQAAAQVGGYRIQPVPDAKSDAPANTVTSQSPAANTPIKAGEVVIVHVSPGPPMVTVPDVQGWPLPQALQAMRQAGFQVTVNQEGPGSKVGSYSPTTPQPKGSTITLNVGFFSQF